MLILRDDIAIRILKRFQIISLNMDADKAYRQVRERAEMRSEVSERIQKKARALSELPDH